MSCFLPPMEPNTDTNYSLLSIHHHCFPESPCCDSRLSISIIRPTTRQENFYLKRKLKYSWQSKSHIFKQRREKMGEVTVRNTEKGGGSGAQYFQKNLQLHPLSWHPWSRPCLDLMQRVFCELGLNSHEEILK